MTALWTPADLRAATGGLLRTPFAATGVSIDTRTLRPGDLFVALVGESDGHRWVRAALDKGAAGALVHTLPDDVADDAPLLAVPDTLEGLRGLARECGVGPTPGLGHDVGDEQLHAVLDTVSALFRRVDGAHGTQGHRGAAPGPLVALQDQDLRSGIVGGQRCGEAAGARADDGDRY